MTSPSGAQHAISSGGYRAVVTESGATLRHLSYDGRDLVVGLAEEAVPAGGRGQVLVPGPKRIRDGRYSFAGASQQLGLSEAARHNASHGLVRWASWQRVDGDERGVTMGLRLMAQSGYPWSLDLRLAYTLDGDGMSAELTATNLADSPAPFACGFHPYLTAGSVVVDADVLTLPVDDRLVLDPERKLPTGEEQPVTGTAYDFTGGRPVGDVVLDDPFRRTDGSVTLVGPDGRGVELWADDAFGWLQVYSADDTAAPRSALAVEPMTAPPDAFNSGTDLVLLEPGGVFRGRWGIRRLG
ncbi:MAG: Aldose 1-epimerase [Nocardioidaceae bacterium]|nr:Aldose 1-epimerase [Nocardioidaceae bacterium]